MKEQKKILIIFLAVIFLGAFYFCCFDSGLPWGDPSMYIQHAKNIVENKPFKDTGYIINPYNPSVGPPAYPPIYPMILAPIYKLFGMSFIAMRIESTVFLLLSFVMIFLLMKNRLNFWQACGVVLLTGVNPFFWESRNSILSEPLFIFLVYLSLWAIEVSHVNYEINKSKSLKTVKALLVGFLLYALYGTRFIGASMVLALFIFDIFRHKKITKFTFVASTTSLLLIGSQSLLFTGGNYYIEMIGEINVSAIFRNLYLYAAIASDFFIGSFGSKIFRIVLSSVFFLLIFIGFFEKTKKDFSHIETFFLLYVSALLLYGRPEHRFLLPILPILLFYLFCGMRRTISSVRALQGKKIEAVIMTSFASLILMSSVDVNISMKEKFPSLSWHGWSTLKQEGPHTKESQQLFKFIRDNTEQEATFIFYKPRALTLFAGRRASVYHKPTEDKDLWKYMNKINVSYVVVGPDEKGLPGGYRNDIMYLKNFVKRNQHKLSRVFSNEDFEVYKIK